MKKIVALLLSIQCLLLAESGSMKLTGEVKKDAPKELTQKMLSLMPNETHNVFDPYDKNSFSYEGVNLREFVKEYADSGINTVTFKAIDGYVISFTKSEWEKESILIVYKRNDKFIRTKEKGPFRVIYPKYDTKDADKLALFGKWIWMISEAEFAK